VVAPVSKTGGPRFESWIPRSPSAALRDSWRLIPDSLVLFKRLLADDRVPWTSKLVLFAVVGYLAFPFDLIPDFIPVLGQLDDAVVMALGLRLVLRSAGPQVVRELWPGTRASLAALERLAFGRP
jgi:uncharacterized membrane protein YkvA (DUF1232 family)